MYCRAGAHWLPHARAHEPVICDWDVQTYDYWLEMMRQEDEDRTLPPSGIKV
jgi:D-amino-acid oxidase